MKIRLVLITAGILFGFKTNGQQRNFEKDSSWKRFVRMQDDTSKVLAFFSKSLETSVYDLELSGFYAHKTYNLAKKLKFTKGIIYSCDLLGNYYMQTGRYDEAYTWMNRSIKLKEKKNDPFDLAIGYNQIAVLFRTMENYPMAKKYSKKSIQQSVQLKNDRFIGLSTSTLSNIFYENKELDSALFYNEKALTLHRSSGDSSSVALSLTNQGVIYNELKQYDKAIEKSTEGKNFIRKDDIRVLLICESNLASSFLAKNDILNAEKSLTEANRLSENFVESDQQLLLHKLNAEYNYLKGNYQNAYEFRLKYQEMRDSIDNINMKKDIAELETKYESARKDKENQELKFLNEKKQLELEENERKSFQLKMMIAGAGIILVLMIFVIFQRIRTAKKLAEQNTQINKQNTTLKTLNVELIESEEQLQKADQAKAELLSIISHDISSPVNAISGYQSAVLSKSMEITKEELIRELNTIHSNTEKLQRLTDQILEYAFTQQHGFTKKNKELLLQELTEECISVFDKQKTEKNLRIITKDLEIRVNTDPDLLKLAIRNIVSNAIKFSPENSVIDIIYDKNANSLAVINFGSVLSDEQIKNLTEGTNFVSVTGTKGEKGTGLGMKIMKKAIELLEYKFTVRNIDNNRIEMKIIFHS